MLLKFNNSGEFPALYQKDKMFDLAPVRFYNDAGADDIGKIIRVNSETVSVTFYGGNTSYVLEDFKVVLEESVPNIGDAGLFDFSNRKFIFCLQNGTYINKGWSFIPNSAHSVIIAIPYILQTENKKTIDSYRISTFSGMMSWPVILWKLKDFIPSKYLPTEEGIKLAIELICGRHGIPVPNNILLYDIEQITTCLTNFYPTSSVKPRIKSESLTELTKILVADSNSEGTKEIPVEYFLSELIGLDKLPDVQWTDVQNDLEFTNVSGIHLQNGKLFFQMRDDEAERKLTQEYIRDSLSVILQLDKDKIVICRRI